MRCPGGINSLAKSPQPCICERPWRQHWLKAEGFLKEREEENFRVEESNSASNEELLRRNEARALRLSVDVERLVRLIWQELGVARLASGSGLPHCERGVDKYPQVSLLLILLGWRMPLGKRRAAKKYVTKQKKRLTDKRERTPALGAS